MAIIELQDPLSTEIQSTTVSGAVDALNIISKGLDLGSELLEKVQMYPIEGLELSDPRRIYQVENGNRLWLSSPNEPVIYVNDSEISQSENEFSIDYIGGSITFGGDYRPGAEDVVTVSCAHISSQSKVYAGSEIKITFTPGFLGQQFTVTGGEDESYSGIVDSTYESTVRVKSVNTTYTVSANSIAGKNFSAKVEIGPYYGQYEVTLSSFSATIEITTEPTATVTVNGTTTNYNANANESGKATVIVVEEGTYSVTSTYKNANSDTKTVQVSSDGETYKTTNTFITLTVTVDAGSTVKAQNGSTTLTETSNGTVKFWLPNTGTWNVTASLDGQSKQENVECSSYTDYTILVSYFPNTLNDCTWQEISDFSSSGKISSYYDVGDTKTIVLNGTLTPQMQETTYYSNVSIDVFVIGFNHNYLIEGSNITHFEIGKIAGVLIALGDRYKDKSASGMFLLGRNATGWDDFSLRNNLYNNGTTSNTVYGLLPEDLRSVMKSVTKYFNSTSSAIKSSNDYLSVLSEFEITGTNSVSISTGKEQQYDYYKFGNARIFHNYSEISAKTICWTRSSADYSGGFCNIDESGNIIPSADPNINRNAPIIFFV